METQIIEFVAAVSAAAGAVIGFVERKFATALAAAAVGLLAFAAAVGKL